jgi:hypothetical protein
MGLDPQSSPTFLGVGKMLAEITGLIDCEVELLARSITDGVVYMIVPVDRKRLRTRFWESVRRDPCAGMWASPEAALVGFSVRSGKWLQTSRRKSPSAVVDFIREQLGESRSAQARQVITSAASAGISTAALHRAATRLGVRRQKRGMNEGWLWTLPPEDEPKYSKGAGDA